MKKNITILFCSFLFINCDSNSAEMINFEKNVETSKEYFQAFSDEKLDEMKSYVTEDFTWSPPPTGVDSLDINTWHNTMKGFNAGFKEINFTKQLYYAVLFFNDEGKIYHQSEWYNAADLDQNSLVDVVAIIPLTKGYSTWYKGFIKDNTNREQFCDDSRTLVHRDVKDSNKVSVYLYDVDMSKLGEMMTDPAFEKFALSLGEDLANKKVYTLNAL